MINVGVIQDQNGACHLIAQSQPEEFSKEGIENLLRSIKQGFPEIFRKVHYELIIPANGSASIPEEFKR
jgi:hypothetical protein